ncbi:hypothetical protein [Methylopila sp. M107]|uniref:hypothetical protein n=1 Tax=Methylopila sp. M107 TaxID=1101190 RepID=UPI0012DDB397|nr:hypothetical protein [Methylopila sp. M107]
MLALNTSLTGRSGRYEFDREATASKSSGTYSPEPNDFIHSFYAVLHRWESETQYTSDPEVLTSHPSFDAIVKNAELVLSEIISELSRKPSPLVWALDDAYPEEQPYTPDAIGDLTAMSEAWIQWAEHHRGIRP